MKRLVAAISLLAATRCADDPGSAPDSCTSCADTGTDVDAAVDAPADADAFADADAAASPPRVLLFSKTSGFRHDSIPDAVNALTSLAGERNWTLTASEDATLFAPAALDGFDVIVFLMTSGDMLDDAQQNAFESWLASGRGWVGVHSASDTEYDWPWYGELVGAYFSAHPPVTEATLRVERPAHLATHHLAESWTRSDEWYAFGANPRADVHVLLSLDEASYDPGSTAMGDHPIAWYHAHAGGRALYTALGHTRESWSESALVDHVAGGIDWAAGREWERVVLVELDGVSENGSWDPHPASASFPYEVTPERLLMHDASGQNQHLTRRGVSVDPTRAYVVEGLFTLEGAPGGLDSFCFNLNVAGADGTFGPLDTWAINVDAAGGPPSGVMKHMGFVAGAFQQLGSEPAPWAEKNVEYLLRARVDGDQVSVTVLEAGVVLEDFVVDYASFPYQPDLGQRVRIGANTHGTDWSLRSLRVYYPP